MSTDLGAGSDSLCSAGGFVRAWQQYRQHNDWEHNASQDAAVAVLSRLHGAHESANRLHLRWWRGILCRVAWLVGKSDTGYGYGRIVYLWGDVGRGKTAIMDLFFRRFPLEDSQKVRLHYHDFMNDLTVQVARMGEDSSYRRWRPGRMVAHLLDRNFHSVRLLCLDELSVRDIADAMLVRVVLTALLNRGTSVVLTSNVPPAELYAGGLQRSLFLPVVRLLEKHAQVVRIDAAHDYRACSVHRDEGHAVRGSYVVGGLHDMDSQSLALWKNYVSDPGETSAYSLRDGRMLPVFCWQRLRRDGVRPGRWLWLDARVLLQDPISGAVAYGKRDFLELASNFDAMLLSHVFPLDDESRNAVMRMIQLIDIWYDHGHTLALVAQVPLTRLFVGQLYAQDFVRTLSRLGEMTAAYADSAHPVSGS